MIELCSAKMAGNDRRGWIIPIGGAEKKIKSSAILARFVELWDEADPEFQPRVDAARTRLAEILRERG